MALFYCLKNVTNSVIDSTHSEKRLESTFVFSLSPFIKNITLGKLNIIKIKNPSNSNRIMYQIELNFNDGINFNTNNSTYCSSTYNY